MREIRHPDGAPWERTTVVDEAAIDHECPIGQVPASTEFIEIRVAQRVDFDLLAEPVLVHPSKPRICLGHAYELSDEQAGELIRILQDARDHITDLRAQWQPVRLVTDDAQH
ncbi:hypothetical protein [Kineosporia babensis]|uniref:Uncharacterized protein n=1 Tax=Kineosporia babensis TaxID=499548 RepID=A0A9X1NM85_9ACTN|nr:hypothetical protein [Kineosporia babensis]MCD5316670.1 hypothetical protein [Kineosporia babensis]